MDINAIFLKIVYFGEIVANYLSSLIEKLGIKLTSSLILILVYLIGLFIIIKFVSSLKKPLKFLIIAIILWLLISTLIGLFK